MERFKTLLLIIFLFTFVATLNSCTCASPEVVMIDKTKLNPDSIVWESIGGPPGAGSVVELLQNPSDKHELYTLVGNRSLYKSEDKGETWQLMNNLDIPQISTIAVYKDTLFIGGMGVYSHDKEGNITHIFKEWCEKLIVSNDTLFIIQLGEKERNPRIVFTDLASDEYTWQDINLNLSELIDVSVPADESELQFWITVPNIYTKKNDILLNMIVNVEGSGELTRGYLLHSEDKGKTWNEVSMDVPEDVIISNLIQDPNDDSHVILVFRHPILHEVSYPISELIRESYDGGKSWKPVTDLYYGSNGITDCAILDNSYYLLNPFDGPGILKLNKHDHEIIEMPRIEEFGGTIFNLETLDFDYDNSNIAYGKTGSPWALGLVKSEDGMKTWKKMDRDIIASSPTIVLTSPEDANTIFTSGNVIQESYCTRDGGQTWEPFTSVTAGDEVVIDPHNPSHILLVDEMTNMFESHDSGKTFTKIAQDFSSAKILDFEIADDNRIYVSNMGVGISFLGDHGEWQYLTNSPDYAYDIEIDPDDSSVLYATYSPKIFEDHSSIWRYSRHQAENSGWTELLRVDNSKGIAWLEFDPSNSNRLYAGVIGDKGAIYISEDKGRSWAVLNDHFIMCTVWGQSQLEIDPNDSSVAYAATWLGGTWKTENAGETWTLLEEAPISSTALRINRENTDIVYLADRSSPTVWKTEDGGETWDKIGDFSGDGALLVMRVFSDGDIVFASTFHPSLVGGKLYKSTNAGGSWRDVTGNLPKGILDIAVDPTNPENVYVTTNVNGVFKSNDGGENWLKLENHPYVGVYDIEINSDNPNILFTAARGGSLPAWFTEISGDFPEGITFEDDAGVYMSSDAGLNWEKVLVTSASCRVIRIHPDDHNILFAADLVDGLLMSTDGGQNWIDLNSGLDTKVLTSCAIGNGKIYVGTQGFGVYSGDFDIKQASVTWQSDRSNKPVPEVHNLQIEVNSEDSNHIYVSSYPGGLYTSTDGGMTFRDRNAITPSVVVDYPLQEGYYSLAMNPHDSTNMWIGTWGKGIYTSHNGMLLNVPSGLFGKHIRRIEINPKNPDEIYVATKEGVFISEDNGVQWEELNEGLGTNDVLTLKIAGLESQVFEDDFEMVDVDKWEIEEGWSLTQDSGNNVFEGVGHNWARTGDKNWSDYTFQTKIKLIQGAVHVNFRNCDEGRYFLGFHQGGLSLSKQFNKWKEFADLGEAHQPHKFNQWYDLKVEVKGGKIKVYIDGEISIDYMDPEPILNGSIAFETLEDSHVYVDDVLVQPDSTSLVVYAGTAGYGLYRLNQLTNRWENMGGTLGTGFWSPWERRMYQFSSILFDPDVPGKVYYGHFPSGFFVSKDNGHAWIDSSLGLGNDGMFSLSMHPNDHDTLFSGTYNGVARSTDGGRTWELKSNGMPDEQWPYTVAIDKQNPDIMYASTKNGENKGFCHRNEFCGVVMKSTDGGENWFEIMNGLDERSEFYTLLIYPLDHEILFLSTNKGVYMSRNAGESWESINNGLPSMNNQVRDNVADNLALTPDNQYLILGLIDYGVWKAKLVEP
ncbi:MAG TPA: hypothetical protein G4O15_05000 [Dehalococcoidia bacterium]|nr:hypothetical protein [Dehalococcoidia bacterium]